MSLYDRAAQRADDALMRAATRFDSYFNPMTGLGGPGDKGAAAMVNVGARKAMDMDAKDRAAGTAVHQRP